VASVAKFCSFSFASAATVVSSDADSDGSSFDVLA
jgi:hypothetical protein